MAKDDQICFFTLDYRLNGFTVNKVMRDIRNYVENILEENIDKCATKKFFNKFLQVLNLKKEFSSFVKEHGASEEESYAPFIKKHVFELLRNANRWAKIFETEREDRTNKKHRRHIIKMLPHLKEIGKICFFFSPENKSSVITKNITLKNYFNGNFEREYPELKKEFILGL